MGGGELEVHFTGEFLEDQEQGGRIHASRYGRDDAGPGLYQSPRGDTLSDLPNDAHSPVILGG